MAPAIMQALEMCETRKENYRSNGIAYYRSLIMLLTDGYPDHDKQSELDLAYSQIQEAEQSRKVALFTFGINDNNSRGGRSAYNHSKMKEIVVRTPIELTDTNQISNVMEWLSNSLSVVSQSQPGDSLQLPDMSF